FPARRMTVDHAGFDAEVAGAFDEGGGFGVAVEGVMDVVGAVDPEDGHGAAAEVAGGVVGGDPGVAAVSESVDGRFLDGFSFVEKSAAVDGHGGPETIVEGGDEAGGVAAPTDP